MGGGKIWIRGGRGGESIARNEGGVGTRLSFEEEKGEGGEDNKLIWNGLSLVLLTLLPPLSQGRSFLSGRALKSFAKTK